MLFRMSETSLLAVAVMSTSQSRGANDPIVVRKKKRQIPAGICRHGCDSRQASVRSHDRRAVCPSSCPARTTGSCGSQGQSHVAAMRDLAPYRQVMRRYCRSNRPCRRQQRVLACRGKCWDRFYLFVRARRTGTPNTRALLRLRYRAQFDCAPQDRLSFV